MVLRAVVFAGLWAAAPTSSRTVKKQLRWYLGNPPEVQEFILGSNTQHLLNFSDDGAFANASAAALASQLPRLRPGPGPGPF